MAQHRTTDEQLIESHFKGCGVLEHRVYAPLTIGDAPKTKMPCSNDTSTKIERLVWGRAGSSVSRINFMLDGRGTLYVSGDLGDAIYSWYNSDATLDWISRLDLSYMHGKMVASELGRIANEWDGDKAYESLVWHMTGGESEEDDPEAWAGWEKIKDKWNNDYFVGDWAANLGSREEWMMFVNDNMDDLGSDAWEWAGGIGDIKPIRTRLHLLALKLAFGVIEMPVELEAA